MRLRVVELLLLRSVRIRRGAFCALDSTQERSLWGREKHAHMVARRRASQTFHVEVLQTDAHMSQGASQDNVWGGWILLSGSQPNTDASTTFTEGVSLIDLV